MNHTSAPTCPRTTALLRSPSRVRRGFTLLEVTLAALIGSLVVMGCVALFSTIGKSQKRHEIRVAQTNDFTRAYRIIERSMQLLVMADDGATNDNDANERIDRDIQRTDGLALDDNGEDLNTARMALTYDRSTNGHLVYENRSVPPQILRLALRAPPVAGGFQSAQNVADPTQFTDRAIAIQSKQRERERRLAQRLTNSTSGTGGGSGRRTGGSGNTTGADAASALAAANAAANNQNETTNGSNDENAGDDTSANDEDVNEDSFDMEHPRTPGVRAEFVLLPDGDSLTSSLTNTTATGDLFAGRMADGSGAESGWSLWYRELPPRNTAEGLTEEERERALNGDTSGLDMNIETADLALDVDPASLRTIRLISGLRTCQWNIFRKQRLDSQIVALAARELPSYVELSIETLDGRRENWMFEVGWSVGEEPGRPLALGADPINAPQVSSDDPSDPNDEDGGGGGNGSGQGNGNSIGGGGNGGKPAVNPRPERSNPNPKRGNPRNVRTNTGNGGNGGRIGNTSPN